MSISVCAVRGVGKGSQRSAALPPSRAAINTHRHNAAFTLVEILLVIGAIAVLGAVAIVAVQNMNESSRVAKLEADIAVINSAIQVYRASGGALPASTAPQVILDKLKTSAPSSKIAGLRGSMIDLRLVAEMQTASQTASPLPRALWDAAASRFTLATAGAGGVHLFRLDDALAGIAPDTESRTPTLELATTGGGWIWDYTDRAPTVDLATGVTPETGPDPDYTPPPAPTADPLSLVVALSVPATELTYQAAGGAMMASPAASPSATLSVTNAAEIPASYSNSSQFQLVWTTDDTNPLTSGSAQQGASFSDGIPDVSIDISIGQWAAGATQLVIRGAAKALTGLFTNSNEDEASIGITPTTLAAPVIDPPSGPKAVDLPVSIALAAGVDHPAGARIYYTNDGTDPGIVDGNPTGGTLYTGQFNAGPGSNGVLVITARVYGPAEYAQWFTPSAATANTYNTITLAEGALVGSATLNGTFVGSLVYAAPAAGGSMSDITFNSNARILNGNLYLPGTPTIRRTNGAVWSLANDSLFSSQILGWEFDDNGVKTQQTTPRVIDEDGSPTPDDYSVTFNNSAVLEGKVIRRHDSPAFPTIPPPPPPDSSGSISLDSPPAGPLSASEFSTITINSSNVGDVSLNPGHYAQLTANNGTAFVLGDPDNPEVTQFYSFESLTLNSSSDLKIVGKVIVTVAGNIELNSDSVLGNPDHPEWLQLQFSGGNFTANSGSAAHGQLVAPTGSVTFNSGSVFTGSVTASSLTINSSSVVFNLPPVIQN
jgi:type II secretory pathway pseudopilin PulG